MMMMSRIPSTKCESCHWRYPMALLSPYHSSAGNVGPVCGICALLMSNKDLGIERLKFTGPHAEHLRQMALTWRERHPDLAPPAEATS
jgi:hypothetical protein